jgi:hypothetical protein
LESGIGKLSVWQVEASQLRQLGKILAATILHGRVPQPNATKRGEREQMSQAVVGYETGIEQEYPQWPRRQ